MKEIKYIQIGDYLYPDLKVEPLPELTRFGRMALKNLKEHHHAQYFALLVKNELNDYLTEIDKQMNEQYDLLIQQYQKKRKITEELKQKDQMRWVQEMNNIRHCVEEIVINDYFSMNKI